jgi:hypothetical protein
MSSGYQIHFLCFLDDFLRPLIRSFLSISVILTKSSLNSSLILNSRSSPFSYFSSLPAFSISASVGNGSTYYPPSMNFGDNSYLFALFFALEVVSNLSYSTAKPLIVLSFPLCFRIYIGLSLFSKPFKTSLTSSVKI